MSHLGNYAEDYATLNFKFTTVASDGTPTTLTGTPVVSVYAANETGTEVAIVTGAAGLVIDFDGVTGLNNVLIDLSSAAFYAVGKDYQVIITTGTVDGVSVVGYVVAEFSIQNRFMRGTDGANVVVPDAAGVAPTAVEVRQEIDANSTRLDADMTSRAPASEYDTELDANMSSRAPASEYDTEMARITADVATEAKQDIMQTDVTLIKRLLRNRLDVDVSGSQMILYADDGTTPLITWALTEKDDGSIDVASGVPTQRGVPS